MSEHDVSAAQVSDPRGEVRRGLLWLGSASAVARVLELAKVFVVLWCLSKEQLGEATLAWTVGVVLEALNGLGIGQALLQGEAVCERTVASAFWYTMGAATALVCIVCVAAQPLAEIYGHPSLAPLIMVASLKLWFVGGALVPLTLLNRALAYERIALVSTFATLTSSLLTCSLALCGLGSWAPLLGHLSGGAATLGFALIVQPCRPRWCFDWPRLRPHASFGLQLCGSSVLSQVYRNSDYLLVGHWLNVEAVGVYRVAFDLAMTPCIALRQVVSRSAGPVYARLKQQPHALADLFLWTLETLGMALAPVTLLLALYATPLLHVIKGGAWGEAAAIVPWLAVAALLRCLTQTFPQLFHAMRAPGLALWEAILSSVLISAAIALMLHLFGFAYGVMAAAWGWVLAYPLLIAVLFAMTRTLLPLKATQVLRSQRHTLGLLCVMWFAHLMVAALLRDATSMWQLSLGIGGSLGAAALYLRWVKGVRLRGLDGRTPARRWASPSRAQGALRARSAPSTASASWARNASSRSRPSRGPSRMRSCVSNASFVRFRR